MILVGARKLMNTICVNTLRALLDADFNTGDLYWKYRGCDFFDVKDGKVMDNGWNARYYGKSALSLVDDKGYKHGRILRVNIKAHRACFALFHGWWPEYFVDHVDGNRSNNCIRNLRESTHSQNARNRVADKNSTSTYLGVHFDASRSKWVASICVNGKPSRIGSFLREEDAALAYDKMAIKIHGEFARPNF